jgi:hypothetical protein
METMNGSMVIARTKDAVYLRIPDSLAALAGDGSCDCPHCKRSGKPAKWDTLVVPTKGPSNHYRADCAYTVHMPDPCEFIRIMQEKAIREKRRLSA